MNNQDFYRELGQKIKALRKKRKLTQNELCGTYMTRNMLSQIENGKVHPSIDTVLYLARQLQTPAAYFFFMNKDEEAQYEKAVAMGEIRRLYAAKMYVKCAALCQTTAFYDDEILHIYADSEVMLALKDLKAFDFKSAMRRLAAAEEAESASVYQNARTVDTIDLFRFLMQAVADGVFPYAQVNRLKCSDPEFTLYINTVVSDDPGVLTYAAKRMTNVVYRDYLTAKRYIAEENPEEAKAYLRKVTSHPDTGFFTLYFSLADLENCCMMTSDYKGAYECTKRKSQIAEKIKQI